MRYESYVGFSFDLPDGWRKDDNNFLTTFYGPRGGLKSQSEVIQLMIGGIVPQYTDPANRELYLAEPGAEVFRTEIGGEHNAVVLKKTNNSEISIVREGVQYTFSHAHDAITLAAIECIRKSARFPSPDQAATALHEDSDPKIQAVMKATLATSPEDARAVLDKAGIPSVRLETGTMHVLKPEVRGGNPELLSVNDKSISKSSKRWWQFWRLGVD